MEDYGDEDDIGGAFEVDLINFKDKSSRTALHHASYYGHLRVV